MRTVLRTWRCARRYAKQVQGEPPCRCLCRSSTHSIGRNRARRRDSDGRTTSVARGLKPSAKMPIMRPARLVGINHVALEVGDLDAALDLYGRLFSFELRGRVRGMAFLDLGDQFLAVAEGRRQGPDEGRHFGLVVDDREAVRAALAEAGIKPHGGRGLRFTDPWGNQFEIVEYARHPVHEGRRACCAGWGSRASRRASPPAPSWPRRGSATSLRADAPPRRPAGRPRHLRRHGDARRRSGSCATTSAAASRASASGSPSPATAPPARRATAAATTTASRSRRSSCAACGATSSTRASRASSAATGPSTWSTTASAQSVTYKGRSVSVSTGATYPARLHRLLRRLGRIMRRRRVQM